MSYRVGYFGCLDVAGHYLHESIGHALLLLRAHESLGPWTAANLDDCDRWHNDDAAKSRRQPLGIKTLHQMDGWTLLCMWDRSVDTRPGSHAIFLAEGTFTSSEMWAIAKAHFPLVYDRLRRAYAEAPHTELRT